MSLGREEEERDIADRQQMMHGDESACAKDDEQGTTSAEPSSHAFTRVTTGPNHPVAEVRRVNAGPPKQAQVEALQQETQIRFVTRCGVRAVISATSARRSDVLAAMLDSGVGLEMTDEGEVQIDLRGDLLHRIADFLEHGTVVCESVQDFNDVKQAAKFLALDGLTEENVEPLGLRMQLKARRLVIDECDHFVQTFFTPYVEKRLEKGHLDFTVDITDKITSTKKFVNVMERDTAANILKSPDCRKLWVQRMQETTQLRITVKDTKDEHGEFINFRTSVRPAELTHDEVDVTGSRRILPGEASAKMRRTND